MRKEDSLPLYFFLQLNMPFFLSLQRLMKEIIDSVSLVMEVHLTLSSTLTVSSSFLPMLDLVLVCSYGSSLALPPG